ncbi:Hsp70 family protein [Nocardia bovistercoris]|uniref:Hsp70 family protein n=1 Tax=Nocardia bovistercoris TaxID=2785916 RepID=A0A931N4D8_9NOCA|nr:Hsp70 family protein [Nocardia bovistercoris]MBH0777518.1 Hsp70 family protein [Nocardia bovistercoris]
MRTSLGISAGNEVVCSAVVSTAPNGAQTFDYRVVSADAAHSDLGDLVASSIELMTNQLPTSRLGYDAAFPADARSAAAKSTGRDGVPTSVAVAYRSKEQAQVIRAATGKQRDLRLVPEGDAALTYLRHTGLLDRYDTVAIIDLGASGLSVTVADRAESSILRSERTTVISGNAIDDLIYQHLVDLHYARRGTRPNRGMLTNRGRAAKEHLSVAPAVTIDHVAGRPLKLTRADFEELITELLRDTAAFAAAVFARASRYPQAAVVIGGGANIPAVVSTLCHRLKLPVHTVEDPESVIAKGAALVADSAQPSSAPVTARGADTSAGTFTKVAGILAGAIAVVGLVIGYGIKTFAPTSDDQVSPAGTTSSAQHVPSSVAPSSGDTTRPSTPTGTPDPTETPDGSGQVPTTTATPIPSTQPTLRPDPNLPPIPYPAEILGPLLGGRSTPSGAATGHTSAPTTGAAPSTPTQEPARSSIPLPAPPHDPVESSVPAPLRPLPGESGSAAG